MFYGTRYDPEQPYKHGGMEAALTPRGIPAPGMTVTSITGRTKMVSPGPVYHGLAPLPHGVATYQRYPKSRPDYIGTAWPATPATPGMPAAGFPAGTIMPPPDVRPSIFTDPATGKIQWWVWGIVAAVLLYIVKKYIV